MANVRNTTSAPITEDVEFIDAEEYHPQRQGTITYEQIVLEQIRRCISEGSKEMAGGYFKEKQTSRGVVEIYVPDQRQIYIRSIISFRNLLLSFYDEEMEEEQENFLAYLNEIKEKSLEAMKVRLENTRDKATRLEILRQLDTKYLDINSFEAKHALDERLDAYETLFQCLLLLFNRKKYLMQQAITE